MFKRVIDTNKYLYHYTKKETANKILSNFSLRFSIYTDTNDPKECKHWAASLEESFINKVKNEGNKEKKSKMLLLFDDFNEKKHTIFDEIKEEYQVLCFCMDREEVAINENSYIYRGFANPTLWTHYADRHKGVCLLFEKVEIDKRYQEIDKVKKFKPSKVIYNNEMYEGNPQFIIYNDIIEIGYKKAIDKYFEDQVNFLFFTKIDYWKSENEFRYVLKNSAKENIFINIKKALKAVICGEEVSPENKDELELICKENRIPMFSMDWLNGYPTAYIEDKYNYMNNYELPY